MEGCVAGSQMATGMARCPRGDPSGMDASSFRSISHRVPFGSSSGTITRRLNRMFLGIHTNQGVVPILVET